MITCGIDCNAVCDFCKFYSFNGNKHGFYIGKGFCNLLKKSKDPANDCKRFHCAWADKPQDVQKWLRQRKKK